MCMCICMGTKTISIMEDAYKILATRKSKGESFSEVIRKMASGKQDIMRFAGTWKDITDKDAEKMKRDIENLREKSSTELLGKK